MTEFSNVLCNQAASLEWVASVYSSIMLVIIHQTVATIEVIRQLALKWEKVYTEGRHSMPSVSLCWNEVVDITILLALELEVK